MLASKVIQLLNSFEILAMKLKAILVEYNLINLVMFLTLYSF